MAHHKEAAATLPTLPELPGLLRYVHRSATENPAVCVRENKPATGPVDGNSPACAPCALGSFRNATHAQDWGSLACLPCPAGFSTLSVATVSADGCQQCPAGAYTADCVLVTGSNVKDIDTDQLEP
jgi:hypothetical protein